MTAVIHAESPTTIGQYPRFCQTEIGNLGRTLFHHQEVKWFHVLVNNSPLMFVRMMQSPGKLNGNIQDALQCHLFPAIIKTPSANPILKRARRSIF